MRLTKKICMLGAFAVGKTSLVRRFVQSVFDERYQTTIGVKVDKKEVALVGVHVKLMLWDLAGEDELQRIRPTYLRGAAGYILVADGTRDETLSWVREIDGRVRDYVGPVPRVLAVNKRDLVDAWEVEDGVLETFVDAGIPTVTTSAKSGANVEELFMTLTRALVPAGRG